MELLLGCFFNAIWLLSAFVVAVLLTFLFSFIPLPAFIEVSATMAYSFIIGLGCMCYAATPKTSYRDRRQAIREAISITRMFCIPMTVGFVVAIVTYYVLKTLIPNEEILNWVSGGIALASVFIVVNYQLKHLEARMNDIKQPSKQRKIRRQSRRNKTLPEKPEH